MRKPMILIKLNGLSWLALGLVCFVSACSAPGAQPMATSTGASPSDSQAAVEKIPVLDGSQATPIPAAETPATPQAETASAGATFSRVPTPGRIVTSEQAPTPPPETPTPGVEAPPQETMPSQETMPDKPTTQPGPSEEQRKLLASLQSRGPAPELSNQVWLNSEPLRLADLRGKVVLVEFWTFG